MRLGIRCGADFDADFDCLFTLLLRHVGLEAISDSFSETLHPMPSTKNSHAASLRLLEAARSNSMADARSALENGAHVDARPTSRSAALRRFFGRHKETPLMAAANAGYHDMARLLLDNSADVNAQARGATALQLAARRGLVQMVQLLLTHEASIDQADRHGWTPLMLAVRERHTETAKLLLKRKASIDLKLKTRGEEKGATALLLAASRGHVALVELLLSYGASINLPDARRATPIARAAAKGHLEVVKLLATKGADLHGTRAGLRHKTSLQQAQKYGRAEIISFLEQFPANLSPVCQPSAADPNQNFCCHNSSGCSAPGCQEEKYAAEVAQDENCSEAILCLCSIPEQNVQLLEPPFASGSNGQVYRTQWCKLPVVVKCVDVLCEDQRRAFLHEVEIWAQLRDKHIVALYSAYYKGRKGLFVCEDATQGTLKEFLCKERESGHCSVWRKFHQVALGLNCLHEKSIIHGDLKCNNILVGVDDIAMVADFGSSIRLEDAKPMTEPFGALRWKAPECIRSGDQRSAPTLKSDVYSLGMCIVEAVTGQVPWGRLSDLCIRRHLRNNEPLNRPPEFANHEHWKLVQAMCALEPSNRITLAEAIDRLEVFAVAEQEREQQARNGGDNSAS